jgi:hypothetical protein
MSKIKQGWGNEKMENKTLEILLVEDNPSHMESAKKVMAGRIANGDQIEISYAVTYVEAKDMMAARKFDGIISDIFLPYSTSEPINKEGIGSAYALLREQLEYNEKKLDEGDYNEMKIRRNIHDASQEWINGNKLAPLGVIIVQAAWDEEIPIVLCTDSYHHGYATEPINQFRQRFVREIKCKDGSQDYVTVAIIDPQGFHDREGNAPSKDFGEAYEALVKKIQM